MIILVLVFVLGFMYISLYNEHNSFNASEFSLVQLGSLTFAHLFFVNNSALDASLFKISVPIIKRIS